MKENETTLSDRNILFFTVVTALLVFGIGVSVAFNLGRNHPVQEELEGVEIPMQPTPKATELHLNDAKIVSKVNVATGEVRMTFTPGASFQLPENTALEAFLIDDGAVGDLGISSQSKDDEFYGPALLDTGIASALNAAPFAESLGRLKKMPEGDYTVEFSLQNSLVPYDRIVITLESDRAFTEYDPRPATTLFVGELLDTIKPRKVLEERKVRENNTVAP